MTTLRDRLVKIGAKIVRHGRSITFPMAEVRRVCRNVKHWRDAAMALRWTGAAMLEAAKGFRRLKAHRQLPIL